MIPEELHRRVRSEQEEQALEAAENQDAAESREDASPVESGKAADGQAEGNQIGENLMESTWPDDRNEEA